MRRPLTRVSLAILLAAILIVGAGLPAAADYQGPVERIPWVDPGGTIIGMCPFDVRVTIDQLNETSTVWERPDGSWVWHLTGVSKTTWTNLSTGYSISRNLSGPVMFIYYSETSTYRHFPGPQAMGDSPYSTGPTWFAYGNLKVWVDSEAWGASWHGRLVEICDALNH